MNFGFGNRSDENDWSQYGEKKAVRNTIKVTPVRTTADFKVLDVSYQSPTMIQNLFVCFNFKNDRNLC